MRPRFRRAGVGACAALILATAAPAGAASRAPTGKDARAWSALVVEAEAAQMAGDWRRLEQATRRRAAIEERTYGPEAPITAASWSWIGQALVHRGRDAEAEPYFRKALAVDRGALGAAHPQTLIAMSNLAALFERQGRFAEAEPLRRELHDAGRSLFGASSAAAAAGAVALGDVLRALGRATEAEPLYRAALEIDTRVAGEADPRVAADLGALAAALDDLGRHAEAEPLHRRALALRRQAFGERDAATAQAYARIAANLDAQGRHVQAEPLHRLALATDQELRGRSHPATAADAAALGANLTAQGKSDEAQVLLREALAIRRKVLGERHADTGASYGALADALASSGQRRKAEGLHRRALEITRAARGERTPATATLYAGLAGDLVAQGRHAQAEPLLLKALEIRRATLGERHPDTGRAYDALAEAQHRQAANTGAEQMSARAVAIVRARRAADRLAVGSGPDAALRRARAGEDSVADGRPTFRRYLTVAWDASQQTPGELPRLQNAAFTAAQDLNISPAARALAETTARAALGKTATARDARVRQALAGQVRELEGQLVQALPQNDPGEAARIGGALDAVGRELASLDARLSRDNPRYAETVSPPALSIPQAQARLRTGEGLLLIVPAGEDVHVFAISRNRAAWNRITRGQADLERRIRTLRCQVDDSACSGRRTAAGESQATFDGQVAFGVYRDLIAPLEPALAGVDRLYVTSSGALAGLPLALLPTRDPGGVPDALAHASWLADRYALTTLPSVASLRASAHSRRGPETRWSFVGYGDPTLKGASPDRRLADPKALAMAFGPLPGTADELRAMARTLGAPQASLRLGGRATEAALKSSPDLAAARVVAIATHGLLSREIGGVDEPGLVLTPPARATSQDDGVLTASEAAALDLSADWVILSACNTAAADGTPGADSLSGLARAFLYAGARALLVSHWRVYDDATAALTVQTLAIQRANPRLTKSQALQRAMRAVRTGRLPTGGPLPGWRPEWSHPAYWAPFVLIAAEG
ncbi:MAG: tetratricopeptide repeat protein [Phenylobacterium sp.]|nr:MAG: tetratricopeptide repeat protein [Phenylobacterium sp.]